MKKIVIIALLFTVQLYGQNYSVGQTVSVADQMVEIGVCYGEYPIETFKLVDMNGDLNGGSYKVLFIDMTASW